MIIFDKIIQIGSLFRYESWELLLAAQSLHWVWAEFLLDIKSNLDWTDWNYIFILKMKIYLICSKYPVKNPYMNMNGLYRVQKSTQNPW